MKWNSLIGKYVTSPIDNKNYCRKNGQFLRHLRTNGFEGYQDFFQSYFPEHTKTCSCGHLCKFNPTKMKYALTCGKKSCVNKAGSLAKQRFSQEKWNVQREKFRLTMEQKSDDEKKQISKKRKKTNLQKFGYDHPWKSSIIRKKISDTMEKRYGSLNFSTTLISSESKELLEDKKWLYTQHVTNQLPLYVIAKQLNVGDRTVGNYLHKHKIPTHSFQRSRWEREMEEYLTNIHVDFVSNTTSIIPPKQLDFFISRFGIAIELCGLYWHSEVQERISKHYHENKTISCNNANIQLLTIFEDEWKHKDIIFSKLNHLFHQSCTKIYARDTMVDFNVSSKERKKFFQQTHIQGNGKGSINIALRNSKNNIVALGLFSNYQQQKNMFVLERFSTSVFVPGALGKILKRFEKEYDVTDIITFADKRWSNGSLYLKLGFDQDKILPPDYSYVVRGERIHKFNFRHSSLTQKLSHYDPNKSERDNCYEHGIYRVWDCGKIRFRRTSNNE